MKTQAYSNTNVIILDRVFMIATLLLRSPTTILSSRTNHFTTATLNLLCFASTNRTRLPWRLSICEISICGVLDIDMRDIDMQRKQMRTICGIALSCTLLKTGGSSKYDTDESIHRYHYDDHYDACIFESMCEYVSNHYFPKRV